MAIVPTSPPAQSGPGRPSRGASEASTDGTRSTEVHRWRRGHWTFDITLALACGLPHALLLWHEYGVSLAMKFIAIVAAGFAVLALAGQRIRTAQIMGTVVVIALFTAALTEWPS